MPKIDLDAIVASNATGYPTPYDAPVAGRWWKRLAPTGGLTEMGASHVTLKPGGWSSQRHWHDDEDELLVVLFGEAVLIEDSGRTLLRAGDVCAWKKGTGEGHHIVNEGEADFTYIAISAGDRNGSGGYSDIDMMFSGDGYYHKDGTPYPSGRLR